ncbi:MAG: rod shape-determining protein MreC [Phycisphaerales bacterium]
MRRRFSTFHIFLVTVALTLAMAVALPTQALWWVNDLSSIVHLATAPFGDAGTRLRIWLQGSEPGAHDPVEVRHLRAELDHFRALFASASQENQSLIERIEQYERTRYAGAGVNFDTLAADITGRNAQGDDEVWTLNVGSRKGVELRCVAVFDGSHLVGRISDVGAMTSSLIPITEHAAGYMRAAITPADSNSPRVTSQRAMTDLRAVKGRAILAGDVDHDSGVEVGDYVHLDDPDWPATAQSMIIGRIVEITPKDNNPLRLQILVQPRYRAGTIGRVTLKIERPTSVASFEQGGNQQ